MKQLKLIALLMLALSIVLASFTSCEYLEDFGISIPGLDLDKNPDTTPDETPDNLPDEIPDDKNDQTTDKKPDTESCEHYDTKTVGQKEATCTETGYTGDKVCSSCEKLLVAGSKIAVKDHTYVDGVCSACGAKEPAVQIPDSWKNYETITIAEALTLCEEFVSSASTQRYYIIATVKSVDDTRFGKLMIKDETGEIMVYGTNSADGSLKYDQMSTQLNVGDIILIYGTLQNYKGNTKEVQNAWLIDCIQETPSSSPEINVKPGDTITIAQAIEIAGLVDTNDRFYIRAIVKTITNPAYGAMIIEDETGEISVYNSSSSNGSVKYADMEDKPYKGDTVLLYCTLQNFNGTKEVKSGWIVEFEHAEIEYDPEQYPESTVAAARDASLGTKVKLAGVVAQITYANGHKPSGIILVDATSSIYVYDADVAGQVEVGNYIEIAGEKTYWILDTETNSAAAYGYKGSCQLDNVILLSNDKGNNSYDKSWIEETTVKKIMDTPVSENITNKIFKVTALVKKVDGTGFINYYIDDIDGNTGSYVYTQCNGSDFAWLDEFDGKFCTVYVVAQNAKSSASGCIWRFLPIEVIDEGYTFNIDNAANYAVTYHGIPQFLSSYTGDPAIVLETLVSSELLGFEGATLSYASSNEAVVYFTNENGVITFHCGEAGTATITVMGSHNGNTYSENFDITVKENIEIEYITVAEAIATPFDTDVVVKGIVGPSLVNRTGFYLFGEDGSMIAVLVSESAFEGLAIGNEIIVAGMRERFIKDDNYTTYGQDAIVNGEIKANYYGNHEYSTAKFITGKTLADIKALDVKESHSTEVYIVKATVVVVETAYYTNIKIVYNGVELPLYCSGATQYNWLKAYAGQEITMEIAPCNWNDKQDYYRGCVLAVILEDGTKICNNLNFK